MLTSRQNMIAFLQNSDDPSHRELAHRIKVCALSQKNPHKHKGQHNDCGLRFLCDACTVKESQKHVQKYSKIFNRMVTYNLIPIMVTLSPPPAQQLVDGFKALMKTLSSINQLRKNHFNKGQRYSEFCRPWYQLFFIEVKRTDDGHKWFPHIHSIALNPRDSFSFQQTCLARDWQKISGATSQPHVRLTTAGKRFLSASNSKSLSPIIEDKNKIIRDLKRQLKYFTKPPSLCPADRLELYLTVPHRHFVRQWDVCQSQQAVTGLAVDSKASVIAFQKNVSTRAKGFW